MLDKEQRSHRARIAALTRWSREHPHDNAVRGQNGLQAKWRREVLAEDPSLDPEVDAAEITRRVRCKQRLHMQRLDLKGAEKRWT